MLADLHDPLRFTRHNTAGYGAAALADLNAAYLACLAELRAQQVDVDSEAAGSLRDHVAERVCAHYDSMRAGVVA